LGLDYQQFTALQQVNCAMHSRQFQGMENARAGALGAGVMGCLV
jgi:hypothetical protein